MGKRKAGLYSGVIIFFVSLGLSISALDNNWYFCLLISVIGTVLIFFSFFEYSQTSAEKIVLISVLSALSSVGRVLFSPVPSMQPSSFIIIMTGAVFGGQTGFITGAVTALASNLILGQGPWTLWQMFSWGIMGFLSGAFSAQIRKSMIFRLVYSFLWGFLFGWIMDSWYALAGFSGSHAFIPAYIASFPMDLMHAASNIILSFLFGNIFINKLSRIAAKYGLTEEGSLKENINYDAGQKGSLS